MKKEIDDLNRIVSMWLDFAEDEASMKKQIFLQDWTEKLDAFLAFNDRQVLQTAGTISKTQADEKAPASNTKNLPPHADWKKNRKANAILPNC
jgi:fic family toxin-antitoxin system, toxin component